jgi:hypothetical protein
LATSKSKETPKEQAGAAGSGRGGAREGAGRPPKGDEPRVPTSVTLDSEAVAYLAELASWYQVSRSDIVNHLILSRKSRDKGLLKPILGRRSAKLDAS